MANFVGNCFAQVIVGRCSAWYSIITVRSSGKLLLLAEVVFWFFVWGGEEGGFELGRLTLNDREPEVVLVG